MKKILTVIGARPQFIKAAAVSRIVAQSENLQEVMVHTGQHYDANMSDVFFEELEIAAPKYNLEIGSGAHGLQTGRMLEGIEALIQQEKPQWLLVYGDTNSTLAGALAACKLHVPVAHVEAGLRSFNKKMPEEINRILTDHVSKVLFAPTQTAVENLKTEGMAGDKVCLVGDVMLDVANHQLARSRQHSGVVQALGLQKKSYVLATIHRAENTDDPARLGVIVESLVQLSTKYRVVLPLHPRTRAVLGGLGWLDSLGQHVTITDPVGYLDMVALEENACLVLTDSGGVQKEAFFYGVPCVTLRDETEWVELVELGWNRLAPPTNPASVLAQIDLALFAKRQEGQPYGQGDAAKQIVAKLQEGL